MHNPCKYNEQMKQIVIMESYLTHHKACSITNLACQSRVVTKSAETESLLSVAAKETNFETNQEIEEVQTVQCNPSKNN